MTKPKNSKNRRITIRLPDKDYDALERLSDKCGIQSSALVRYAIRKILTSPKSIDMDNVLFGD